MSKQKVSKPKKSKAPLIPPTEKVELIPEDLKNLWGSVQATSTAFNCLDKGYFPHNYAQVVKASLAFLAKLHEQQVEVCLKHPQAHMISELKELGKQKEEKNVEAAQAN